MWRDRTTRLARPEVSGRESSRETVDAVITRRSRSKSSPCSGVGCAITLPTSVTSSRPFQSASLARASLQIGSRKLLKVRCGSPVGVGLSDKRIVSTPAPEMSGHFYRVNANRRRILPSACTRCPLWPTSPAGPVIRRTGNGITNFECQRANRVISCAKRISTNTIRTATIFSTARRLGLVTTARGGIHRGKADFRIHGGPATRSPALRKRRPYPPHRNLAGRPQARFGTW